MSLCLWSLRLQKSEDEIIIPLFESPVVLDVPFMTRSSRHLYCWWAFLASRKTDMLISALRSLWASPSIGQRCTWSPSKERPSWTNLALTTSRIVLPAYVAWAIAAFSFPLWPDPAPKRSVTNGGEEEPKNEVLPLLEKYVVTVRDPPCLFAK